LACSNGACTKSCGATSCAVDTDCCPGQTCQIFLSNIGFCQ
jgi:hypothetical protein